MRLRRSRVQSKRVRRARPLPKQVPKARRPPGRASLQNPQGYAPEPRCAPGCRVFYIIHRIVVRGTAPLCKAQVFSHVVCSLLAFDCWDSA